MQRNTILVDGQLSRQQELALEATFFSKLIFCRRQINYQRKLRLLILRAYIIYKRCHYLETSQLIRYHLDFKNRLQVFLGIAPNNYKLIPNYVFIFLEEIDSQIYVRNYSHPNEYKKNQNSSDKVIINRNITLSKQQVSQKNHNHTVWAKLCLTVCTNHPFIRAIKKHFGCISLVPVTIKNEHLKIRNICIHYHDLCHLEVAKLERIQMGKYMVSGIHGLKVKVFHDIPIDQEYDGFFDEARIAIHEWLTRTTIFSTIKVICWLILLMLYGINPIAVVIRHVHSIENKQRELNIYFSEAKSI